MTDERTVLDFVLEEVRGLRDDHVKLTVQVTDVAGTVRRLDDRMAKHERYHEENRTPADLFNVGHNVFMKYKWFVLGIALVALVAFRGGDTMRVVGVLGQKAIGVDFNSGSAEAAETGTQANRR